MASFDWPKCLDFQGDTCQKLIGSLMLLLTHADIWHVSLLTRANV